MIRLVVAFYVNEVRLCLQTVAIIFHTIYEDGVLYLYPMTLWSLKNLDLPMSMRCRGGMILTGKPKDSEKNLSQCHFAHNKSHMD
jgi:hypothetical protein